MDKVLILNLLYDFYGELLTEKQRDILKMYYQDDFSLNEIGEEFGITRQAVHDLIKRSEKILFHYEEKLLLMDKYLKQKDCVDKIKEILNTISCENEENQELKQQLINIDTLCSTIIESEWS